MLQEKPKPHTSVLVSEVVKLLPQANGGIFVDATFGAGGYSRKVLETISNSKIVAIDRDENVQKFAQELAVEFGESRVTFVNSLFSKIDEVCTNLNIFGTIDGIMMDLGVSSMQLDEPNRGFSFNKTAPLSMQMGKNDISAEDVVNKMPENALANIIYNYGNERFSRKIAAAIVKARNAEPITTTTKLADIVKACVPFYNDNIHPATRTFQAIRIHVNRELEEIEKCLHGAYSALKPGGVICAVSFHSLEDKLIKCFMRDKCRPPISENRHFITQFQTQKFTAEMEELTKKPIAPSDDEIKKNPRSRSAKLRAARKV